jgi:hypothetical protein
VKEELQYTIDKINKAKLYENPYPFLEIKGIFSEGFYQDIIKNKPKEIKYFRPLSKMYSDRHILELGYGENVNNSMAVIPFENVKQKKFWKEFQEIFIKDNTLAVCYIEKYKSHLDKSRTMSGKINCRLSKDYKGYSIGVHRDKKDKLLSALFYLADCDMPDRQENWGTQILMPKKDIKHTDQHHTYNEDGSHDLFKVYKTVTFEPNKMFSWCVTEQSYHGVVPTVFDGVRDSMAFFIKSKLGIR